MNEFEFIKHLRSRLGSHIQSSEVLYGIGDDAAVVKPRPGREVVISVDLLVEDIDFRRITTTPRLLGHKGLAVSLSDIAAMGSSPKWALLSVGVPEEVWAGEFVDQLYDGVFQLADRFKVKLIGGDTSRTPEKIVVDSILLGDCAEGRAISRAGARPGQLIFLTGTLGGAAAGLRLLNRGAKLDSQNSGDPDAEAIERVLRRQLSPEPRVGWGVVLGEESLASAMIDISDGLSSDLHHLCAESDVGALVDASKIPIDPSVTELCGRRALDPLMLALHGGEDFELLFTVSPENLSRLPKRVDGVTVTCIGTVEAAGSGVRIAEGSRIWNLEPQGWEHFGRGE